MIKMEEIKIKTEFIKLQQLLKLAGLVEQGSDAKLYIADGLVTINGTIVTERGKKVYPGDIISLEGQKKIKVI